MRIGVNALYLIPGQVGGTEIYLRSLIAALEEAGAEPVVFTNREAGRLGTRSIQTGIEASNRPARILFEQLRLPALMRRERISVLLNPGFTAPLRCPVPQVTVFHDLQHKRHPEYFRRFDLPAWQFLLWGSARRSSRLIAVSEATRDDMLRFYPFLTPDRIDVVHHGVDRAFFRLAESRQPGDFLLCASTTHPHKNHARLLRAFQAVHREQPGLKLVLTGVRGFRHDEVSTLLRELKLTDAVVLKGWVTRDELLELFRTARAFVYPTLFEGFGMPVMEALAARIPTACSAIEPLTTLAGPHPVYFDPLSQDSLEAALRGVLTAAPPPADAVAGFSWRRCAEQTIRSLELAAKQS